MSPSISTARRRPRPGGDSTAYAESPVRLCVRVCGSLRTPVRRPHTVRGRCRDSTAPDDRGSVPPHGGGGRVGRSAGSTIGSGTRTGGREPIPIGVNVIWLLFDFGRASALERSAAQHGLAAEDDLRAEGHAGSEGR